MKLNEIQIKEIKDYFRDKPIQKAFLFGSFAEGTAAHDSDIDILVELDYSMPIGLQFLRMKFELEDILNHKVDLLSDKAISKYMRPAIEKQKQLIYEK